MGVYDRVLPSSSMLFVKESWLLSRTTALVSGLTAWPMTTRMLMLSMTCTRWVLPEAVTQKLPGAAFPESDA